MKAEFSIYTCTAHSGTEDGDMAPNKNEKRWKQKKWRRLCFPTCPATILTEGQGVEILSEFHCEG